MSLIPRKYYLEDFFDDFVTRSDNSMMKCDIYEVDGNYKIELDVPGFDKKDIKIECKKGYLTITAKRTFEEDNSTKNYIRKERSYGEYTRSFYFSGLRPVFCISSTLSSIFLAMSSRPILRMQTPKL